MRTGDAQQDQPGHTQHKAQRRTTARINTPQFNTSRAEHKRRQAQQDTAVEGTTPQGTTAQHHMKQHVAAQQPGTQHSRRQNQGKTASHKAKNAAGQTSQRHSGTHQPQPTERLSTAQHTKSHPKEHRQTQSSPKKEKRRATTAYYDNTTRSTEHGNRKQHKAQNGQPGGWGQKSKNRAGG